MTSVPFVFVVLFAAGTPAAQPQSRTPVWTGYVRCAVDVKGPGYVSHQTHTWTLTGTLPPGGGVLDYPATWSVTGEGSMQPAAQPSATWTTNGSEPGVRMAIFVRQADQRLDVLLRHAQLTAREATTLVRQPSTRSQTPVTEWRPFPTIVEDSKSTHITGSITNPVSARIDAMQPPGSQGQAACTWDLVQTGVAPAVGAASGGVAVAPKNAPAVSTAGPPSGAASKTPPAGAPATPVEATRAPASPDATTTPPTKPTVRGCANASERVVNVSRGQSQAVTGAIKTSGSIDWLTVRFASGTSVHLTLSNAAPAADVSDFQLQAFSDCSSMIVMTTGTGEKTLDFPDSGPHEVLVRIVASEWKATSPTYRLKLEGR